MIGSPLQSLYKKWHLDRWGLLWHFMSEQLGYMPHLSTLMLTINLVNMCFFYLTNYVLEMRITWGGGGVGGGEGRLIVTITGLVLLYKWVHLIAFVFSVGLSAFNYKFRCGSWEKGSWGSVSSPETGSGSTKWGQVGFSNVAFTLHLFWSFGFLLQKKKVL